MLFRYFLNYFRMVPVALILLISLLFFTSHMRCDSTVKSSYIRTIIIIIIINPLAPEFYI